MSSTHIPAYLIDDEPHCTDVLSVLLTRHCPAIHIAGVFNDPQEALDAIRQQRPQLIFLDIEMPGLNGFDLLQACGTLDFNVVFTTAYDQYAVRAFKFNALDYLLKPIEKDELIAAVEKATRGQYPAPAALEAARAAKATQSPARIALPVGQELILVDVQDILYCESDGSYVHIHLQGQPRPVLLSKSLREIEELLQNPDFFRAHNSFLVNLKHIHKILRAEGGEIIMANGKSLPVARAKKADLMMLIAKL